MEGPSIYLAVEQLNPFVGEEVKRVAGNTTIGKERLKGKKVESIFSYGKYLFFQFDTFALRVHFLLFGSFEATVNKKKVTGDYPKKVRTPRLALYLKSGNIQMYSCSVVFIEGDGRATCDFSTDIMSKKWDEKSALAKIKEHKKEEIADVLLDQKIFTGVGNIIKNEVLLMARVSPLRRVEEITSAKIKKIIALTREYVFQFYEWRKNFELRKHYRIYKQYYCKECGNKVLRQKTGFRHRMSFICSHCEK